MRLYLNFIIISFLYCLNIVWISGCVPKRHNNQNESSLLNVKIENIDKDLENIAGVKYILICTNASATDYYVVDGEQKDNNIVFNSSKIKEGDKCSIEIRGENKSQDPNIEYVWLTNPPTEGLFYSSNIAEIKIQNVNNVNTKYLSVTLFKLFSIKYKDAFTLEVDLNFATKYDAEFNSFSKDIIANLICSNQKIYSTSVYQNNASSELSKKFIFNLSASQMQDVSCNKINLIAKNVNLYEGNVSDLKFVSISKDQKVAKGPIKVVSLIEIPQREVKCLSVNNKNKCTAFSLPRNANYWFAVINAKKQIGSNQYSMQYIVTRGSPIVLDLDYNTYDIQDMQLEIQSSSGKYKFFDYEVLVMITSQNFDPDTINNSIKMYRPSPPDMTGVVIENIDSVYLHGVFEITQKELNTQGVSRWFAFVKTYSSSQGIDEFIISPNKKYFVSTNKPINNSYYFDWNLIKENKLWGQYLIYALKTSLLKPTSCKLDINYFVDKLSEFSIPQLSEPNQVQELEDCTLTNNSLNYDNALAIIRLYSLGWKVFNL